MRERKFITETVKKLLVSEYIRRETESAGFGNMEMKRTPFGTNITLHVNKPGLVIGRRGSKIQEITENLEKRFKVESPQIEVKEAENPDLNPQVVSKKIALSLEKGWSYRKSGNTSLRRAMDSDVRGIMIKISGKLSGERSRTQKFFYGSVKYSGEPGRAAMRNGFSIARMKQGVIGVTVKILDPDYRLPDEIDFVSPGTIPVPPPEVSEPESPEKVEPVSKPEVKPEPKVEKPVKVEEKKKEKTQDKKAVKEKPEPEKEEKAAKKPAEKKEKKTKETAAETKKKPKKADTEVKEKKKTKKAATETKKKSKKTESEEKSETPKKKPGRPKKEVQAKTKKVEKKSEESDEGA